METVAVTDTVAETSMSAGLAAVILGMLGVFITIAVVWCILSIVAWWKLFNKAGEKGWKSLIPLYNVYIEYKIAWKPLWFWITVALGLGMAPFAPQYEMDAAGAVVQTGGALPGEFMYVIYSILSLAVAVLSIMLLWKLAKSFGKGTGFFLGLVFLNFIFMLILAFGSSRYIGPEGKPVAGIAAPDGIDKL